MRVSPIRTGYDAILPLKVNDKFVISAPADCKVVKVTKNEVVVEFIDGVQKAYPIKEWTSKEESGACYTNYMVTNVKVGDRLSKDDTIIYNSSFYKGEFAKKRMSVINKKGQVTIFIVIAIVIVAVILFSYFLCYFCKPSIISFFVIM
jgi:hypothetical protein